MITSTTELLNEITSRPQAELLPGNLQTKQSQLSYAQERRREFALHYTCMQSWFLRCSWLEKLDTMTQLLYGLRTIDSLSLILNTLLSTGSKTTVYAECQYSTNFVYDKQLSDHSRSLDKATFLATQEADISWFSDLREDYEQVLIFIGLLRLSGGSIMHQVFERGRKLYDLRLTQNTEAIKYNSLIEIKKPSIGAIASGYNIEMRPDNKRARTRKSEELRRSLHSPRGLNIKPENIDELQKRDPKDPFVIEVDKRRKAWNEMIRKYRIQVEGKPPASPKKGKKSGKDKKSDKSSKSTKGGKSSKSSKSKKGKGSDEELDRIQLLPIWIVKKIFNYLDAKTLKKVKAVNSYWTYAITDLQKEQKARKYLDKFISKMEAGISTRETQTNPVKQPSVLKETCIYTQNPKVRLRKLWERGAVAPNLVMPLEKPITEKCLTVEAAIRTAENYVLPVNLMESFPRSWSKYVAPLYRTRPCLVNELGFTIMDIQEIIPEASTHFTDDDPAPLRIKRGRGRIIRPKHSKIGCPNPNCSSTSNSY